MNNFAHTIFPLGDAALVVEFGAGMEEAVNRQVHRLFRRLQSERIPWVRNLVPAYNSLTVCYDTAAVLQENRNGSTAYEAAAGRINRLVDARFFEEAAKPRKMELPVCYHPSLAPDLEALAGARGLSTEEVIGLHAGRSYTVYMIGFLPGFAYMGRVDERIALPRRPQPRPTVAAGSVGIAGEQTGIYPLPSPGGWQLIGRTPVELFDPHLSDPVLLRPGDTVTFYPISLHEFNRY